PDLVFLDIQMPELDGFSVLRQLEADRLPVVIFVTAYDAFAVKAFDAHALDYLVKPLHEARFQHALARARERLQSQETIELSRRLLRFAQENAAQLIAGNEEPEGRRKRPRSIVIGTNSSDLILDLSDIEWIEADDYYA